MKIASFAFLAAIGGASASRFVTPNDIRADSKAAEMILNKARRVDENANDGQMDANNYYAVENANGYYANGQYYNPANGGNDAAQAAWYANWQLQGSQWLSSHAIKFLGCYDVSNWNYNAEDAGNAKIKKQSLVRFRLCPANSCSERGNGCGRNYGEYVIDLTTFLEAYVYAKQVYGQWGEQMQEAQEYENEVYENANEGQGQNGEWAQFGDIDNYIYCQETGIAAEGNYGDGVYYMGPTCGRQGGAINLGLFLDNECTVAAGANGGTQKYREITGNNMPFSQGSMIQMDCFSCQEPYDQQYNYAGNDDEDDDDINDVCEVAYLNSGKCENSLPKYYFNQFKTKNNDACNYIEGIKLIRDDGSIVTTRRKGPGRLGKIPFIGVFLIIVFGGVFGGLSYYVYHLKNKFERASIEIE